MIAAVSLCAADAEDRLGRRARVLRAANERELCEQLCHTVSSLRLARTRRRCSGTGQLL